MMRLLVAVLAVLVAGSAAQQQISHEREVPVSQGRITTSGASSSAFAPSTSFAASSGDPCRPSPCGPNTRCDMSRDQSVALCRCLDGYVPNGNTITGCKYQCERNTDCPDDHRCSANKCGRVCVKGACGRHADCRARNHIPMCTCPPNYRGDPYMKCSQEVPEDRVNPPAPPRDPCFPNPCGINADCKSPGDRAVCSCPLGYEGDPLSNCRKGQCVENTECPDYQVCQRLSCVDPCLDHSLCGTGAQCRTRNHRPVCSCPSGYVGNALERCRQFDPRELCFPSPCGENTNCKVENERAVCSCFKNYIGDPIAGCRPECESDFDCPNTNLACRNNICVNPCRDACGENAYCDVKNKRAVCSCPQYYLGEPYSRCYPECTEHDHCAANLACINLRCGDPCAGKCGTDAICKVENHKPICSCPSTHTGDPFIRCRPFTDADYCNPNPCGSSADCQLGRDRDGEKRPVCTCPSGYIGNPLISCELGDCRSSSECRDNQACYRSQCMSPCHTLEGKSVCGESSNCKVVDHVPVCSCPEGYSGDPLTSCYIDSSTSRRFTSGGYVGGRS